MLRQINCQFVLLTLLANSIKAQHGVLDIQYPSVSVAAQNNGNISLQSGNLTHDLYLRPGPQGAVIFDGEDLMTFFTIATSLPPVWSPKAHMDFFGTFHGEEQVNIKLKAEDPEGGALRFQLVAGALPPGIHLNETTGYLMGVAPDMSDIFSFTIRASDQHGKQADAVFKMETIEYDHCMSNPCLHGGICMDTTGSFHCNCTQDYGGQRCEHSCRSNTLNVANRNVIPDAQMSAHLSASSSYRAEMGRYGASGYGWCGTNNNAWLQVDLGNVTTIYRAMTQGYSSGMYTSAYKLTVSLDGNTFHDVNDKNGHLLTLHARYNTQVSTDLPIPALARYVRFQATSYHTNPCFKVELYGCQMESN